MFSSRGTSPIVRSKGLTPATKRAVQTSLGRRSPVNPVTDTNYHAVSVRRGDLPVGQAPIPVVPPGQSVPRLNQGYNYPVKMASDFVKQGYQNFRHPIRRLTSPNQQMMFPGMGGKFEEFGKYKPQVHLSTRERIKALSQHIKDPHEIAATLADEDQAAFPHEALHRDEKLGDYLHEIEQLNKPISGGSVDPNFDPHHFKLIGRDAGETAQGLVSKSIVQSDYGESSRPYGGKAKPYPGPLTSVMYKATDPRALAAAQRQSQLSTAEAIKEQAGSQGGYNNLGPSGQGLWPDFGMRRNPGKGVHLPNPKPNQFPPELTPQQLAQHRAEADRLLGPDTSLGSRKAPREIDDMPDNARNIIHEGGGRPSYESNSPHANDFNNALNELTNGSNADLKARIARNKAFIAKQRLMSSGKSEFNPLEPHAPKNTPAPNNPFSRPEWIGYGPAPVRNSYMRKMVDAQLGTKPVNDLHDLWDMGAMSGGNYKPAPTGEPRGGHKNPLFGEPEYDKGFAQAYDQRGSRQKIFRDISKNKQLSRVMFNYLLKNRN